MNKRRAGDEMHAGLATSRKNAESQKIKRPKPRFNYCSRWLLVQAAGGALTENSLDKLLQGALKTLCSSNLLTETYTDSVKL
ncbi:MAG: hypothetical protein ACLS28_23260 [Clostridium neonatale]